MTVFDSNIFDSNIFDTGAAGAPSVTFGKSVIIRILRHKDDPQTSQSSTNPRTKNSNQNIKGAN